MDLVGTSPESFKIIAYCPFGLENKTKMISSEYTYILFLLDHREHCADKFKAYIIKIDNIPFYL
jgi:hypothetical protein